MSEEPSNYYDEVYNRPGTVYRKRYTQGSYPFKYIELTQKLIQKHGCNAIVEIGCGMGHMLETALHETEELKAYSGLDFSEVGISNCCQIYAESGKQLEDFDLRQVDLNKLQEMPTYSTADYNPVYITHETLEHFEKDLECVSLIPQGALVIISVPDFGGKGHVRWGGPTFWKERYRSLITFSSIMAMGSVGKQHIFLVGKRKDCA